MAAREACVCTTSSVIAAVTKCLMRRGLNGETEGDHHARRDAGRKVVEFAVSIGEYERLVRRFLASRSGALWRHPHAGTLFAHVRPFSARDPNSALRASCVRVL